MDIRRWLPQAGERWGTDISETALARPKDLLARFFDGRPMGCRNL